MFKYRFLCEPYSIKEHLFNEIFLPKGNYSLWGKGAPLMNSVYLESAKKIKNPSQSEVEAGRPTLFDTWVYRHPDSSHSGRPKYRLLAIAKSYLFQLVKEIIFCDGIFILLNGTYRVNILGEAEVAFYYAHFGRSFHRHSLQL